MFTTDRLKNVITSSSPYGGLYGFKGTDYIVFTNNLNIIFLYIPGRYYTHIMQKGS
jgi:hypothetical protein